MPKKLRHIGIIVEDFERAIEKFEGFGLKCTEIVENKEAGMKVAFFPIGDTLIEFLKFSPDKGWDPVHAVVRSQKGVLNHLRSEVNDLEVSIKEFEKNWGENVRRHFSWNSRTSSIFPTRDNRRLLGRTL